MRTVLFAAVTLAVSAGLARGQDDAGARLARARDWLYQLQELDPDAVRASRFDVVVTDPSRDGSDGAWWPRETVDALRASGRVALAYLSIGEAESYRGYWRATWSARPPAWLASVSKLHTPARKRAPTRLRLKTLRVFRQSLGPENPDWKGNYAVRFWDPGWRAILLADDGPLARIVDAGWDGAYLDVVDVYERWSELGEFSEEEGLRRMAAFVRDVSAWMRARRPGFLIIPQNAPALVARADVLPSVDGIGLEDTFFDGERAQPARVTEAVLAHVRTIRAAGKAVLAVDYCRAPARVARFYERARAEGFVPYATVRDLDRLVVDPGHEPQ